MGSTYSLLNRFEGSLLGGVIGEQISRDDGSPAASGSRRPAAAPPLLATALPPADVTQLPWSQCVVEIVQAITQSPMVHPATLTTQWLARSPLPIRDASAWAIATLPIAWYYHDDLNRQRHSLHDILATQDPRPTEVYWVLAYAYAIAQASKGQLEPAIFISPLQAYLRVTANQDNSALSLVLEQLQQMNERVCGSRLGVSPSHTAGPVPPIAIALECFLHSPISFPLACTHAAHLFDTQDPAHTKLAGPKPTGSDLDDSDLDSQDRRSRVVFLTAALTGAYLGAVGIPPTWQMIDSALPTTAAISQVRALAHALLATWARILQPTDSSPALGVVAPWVIRGQ